MARAGIDLGTTNSAVALIDGNGVPGIIKINNRATTPSVIRFCDDGSVIVGQDAKEALDAAEGNCAAVFKRFMGDDENKHRFNLPGSRSYTPTELSAMLLKYLKEEAEAVIHETIDEVIVSVPAYFKDAQRRATRDAAKLAGFKVKTLIEEPVAAALSYGAEHWRENAAIMVYDLGGGTFDVTIACQGKDAEMSVKATDGNRLLGGKNWDNALYEIIRKKLLSATYIDADDDDAVAQLIRAGSEQIKIKLSQAPFVRIAVAELGVQGHSGVKVEVTRQEFEMQTSSLLAETEACCEKALRKAGLTWGDLTDVLLVGGSTRMPQISALIREKTGKAPLGHVNPDESVALGAAIRWLIPDPEYHIVGLSAVSSDTAPAEPVGVERKQTTGEIRIRGYKKTHSLGVVTVNPEGSEYINDVIIPEGQDTPAITAKAFRFWSGPSNDTLEIYVLQGDGKPLACEFLAKYIVSGIRSQPNGTKIRIQYVCDQSGIDNVQVRQDDDDYDIPRENIVRISGEDITPEEKRKFGEPVPEQESLSFEEQNILFVIDTSGSMYGAPLQDAANAMKDFIAGFREQMEAGATRIGLMAFEYGPQIVVPLTSDVSAFDRFYSAQVLQSYSGNGPHPLLACGGRDGIYETLKDCGGKKLAIILTDGEWFCDHSAVQSAAGQCKGEGIGIDAIGFGQAKKEFLESISTEKARTFMLSGSMEIKKAFGAIAQSIGQSAGENRSRQTGRQDESYCDTWDADGSI